MECVSDGVSDLRVFLSEAQDSLHKFPLEWGSLNVTLQKSINWRHRFRNVHGYRDVSHIHIPYDTFSQLNSYHADVVISTELGTRSVLAALYCRRRRDVKLIVWATLSERTEATRGWVRRRIRKWILSSVSAVFVNGGGGASYLGSLGYKGPHFVVPYSIDDKPFRTKNYEPTTGNYRLLYTGQLIPRKGLPAFCQILAEWCINHPAINIQFRLVGEGSEKQQIEQLRTPANLSIEVFDRVGQDILVSYYENADISAFPTLGDEWGVVVNESLIAGRPVLGSVHSQAVVELIEEGSNGWIWDPEESGSLYAALSRAFGTDVEELKSMSSNAKKSIAKIAPSTVASIINKALAETWGKP